MATIMKGLPVAKSITEQLQKRVLKLNENKIIPCLAVVRVGEKEDDLVYESSILKRCEKVGIQVKQFILKDNCSKEKLLSVISEINNDTKIHGCLLFRPLLDKEMEKAACELLNPEKDVDCMTNGSLAYVFSGKGEGFAPCTAEAVVECLKYYDIPLSGSNITVVGRSLVIGKPVSILLQNENATITMAHSHTRNLEEVCSRADILVVAMGKARAINAQFTNPEQTVIDVGINVDENGLLCGDVDFSEVESQVQAITPVPAGIGSITTAVLAKHVVSAAERSL